MFFFHLQSKLQDLAFEFDRTFSASLLRQQGAASLFAESFPNLIEALPTEAELPAHLGYGIALDGMGPQHLVLHLEAVVRIEEIQFEELRGNSLRMRVQSTGGKEGLLF